MDQARYRELLDAAPAVLAVERHLCVPGNGVPGSFTYGYGSARSVGTRVKALTDDADVLLISDRVLSELGLVALLSEWLQASGFRVTQFCDVDPEPHVGTAEAAVELARTSGIRAVVGVGGGSVLDVSKIVALSLQTGESVDALTLPGGLRPGMSMAPLLLLPTTAGTGSETSIYAVLTSGTTKRALANAALVPGGAILDPLLTFSMPKRVTAMTGMDALAHAIEALMHKAATPMCTALSIGAVHLIANSLRQGCAEPENYQARFEMLLGSAMAMMSFSQSGGLWAHSVSYVLGHHFAIPHGLGCALGLPALIRFNEAECADTLNVFAGMLGGGDAAVQVQRLMADIALPTSLKEIGIKEDSLPDLAKEMALLYPRPFNPRPMDESQQLEYWRSMYRGL
ncbi:Alcohol dehydrogenase [Hyphomicrobiales bacterium]|nr:Alcohol dehydrogenase [Hyphomicrobiales bacterium]CAH1692914.1 Alcohol dehydrogenase [Hyphomicrobiales bacterium]